MATLLVCGTQLTGHVREVNGLSATTFGSPALALIKSFQRGSNSMCYGSRKFRDAVLPPRVNLYVL